MMIKKRVNANAPTLARVKVVGVMSRSHESESGAGVRRRSQAPESGAGVRRRSRSQESDDSLTRAVIYITASQILYRTQELE